MAALDWYEWFREPPVQWQRISLHSENYDPELDKKKKKMPNLDIYGPPKHTKGRWGNGS